MKIQLLISYSGTEKAGAKNGETVDITGRGERTEVGPFSFDQMKIIVL